MEPKNGFKFSDYDMLTITSVDDEVLVNIEEGSDEVIVKNGVVVYLRPKDPNKDTEEYR